MKIIPKFQNSGKLPSKEYNKRKQLFLNLNGIKVKVDGSWGPWLELLYKRLTTKDKQYNTTPLGFLSYLYDKTLGDGTTYQEDPAIVKGYSGEIKPDNRSATRRYLDQLMLDNKTPLGYVTQTVLPSAAVAGTLVYGGPAIINGIRTAVSNPSAILPAAKTFVKEGIKGIVGATAVNAASEVTTGKTWGELIAQSTGVSSGLGEFTNPGFLGSSAYNIGKNLYNKGTLWDKYTTFRGRFGYYGNPLQRVWGTISRNLGLPSTPKHPELLRKLDGFPRVTDKGLLDFNSNRTGLLGEGHSNWTLDRPVVSHNRGNWDGRDLFIVDPSEFQKAVPKENVISIEPSDMFVLNANAFIDPRRVTLVSGNPESLILAREMGMPTLSSPRLRQLYEPGKPKTGRFNLDKGNYGNRPYALEQLRLQQRRGTPTIEDFRLIESQYGLNSGVIPILEYSLNSLSAVIKNMLENPTVKGSWSYPNGREVQLIPGGTYLDKALYEESLINKAPYKNVFYDPASHVEINSGVTNRIK